MKKIFWISIIVVIIIILGIFFVYFINNEQSSKINLSEVQEITSKARSEKDVTICDTLPTRETFVLDQVYPRDNCILYVAVDTKNIDLCELFNYKDRKNGCLTDIAIVTKDPEICMKIVTNTPIEAERDSCLGRVASYASDVKICMRISHDIVKATCVQGIAFTEKNISLCEYIDSSLKSSIDNSSLREKCIQSIN